MLPVPMFLPRSLAICLFACWKPLMNCFAIVHLFANLMERLMHSCYSVEQFCVGCNLQMGK